MKPILLFSLLTTISFAEELTHAFIPDGFDDNDRVEFVVVGSLPATSFSVLRVDAVVDIGERKITLTPVAKELTSVAKLERPIPFIEEVKLRSSLPAGEYEIVSENGRELLGKLFIYRATQNDQPTYPEIYDVEVKRVKGQYQVSLKTQLPPSASLDIGYRISTNVIVVFPRAKYVADLPVEAAVPSIQSFTLPDYLRGEYLLHVRHTRQGKPASINRIFTAIP